MKNIIRYNPKCITNTFLESIPSDQRESAKFLDVGIEVSEIYKNKR